MNKTLLFIFALLLPISGIFAQDCMKSLEKAFAKRGAYAVADDMHRNVVISFVTPNGSECLSGKARVENGLIISIFIQFNEGDYDLYNKKFYNDKKQPPSIVNGISEMAYTADGEKFKVIFIEKLKPKQREYKEFELPEDL